MSRQFKPIEEQVIVLTGATSGIGLVTARLLAEKGARLVLAARNEEALKQLCDELNSGGESQIRATYATCDVGDNEQVQRLKEHALQHFGHFDTWINDAGVSIYGKIMEVSLEDQRRLFDTNYWGVVHGSIAAAQHFSQRGSVPGRAYPPYAAIINVGSTVSDRAMPIQGPYSASKHAVKGFTDALRMELEYDKLPVSVTLIKPAAIDTPYTLHAKNYMATEPKNPPPVYAPDTVARAIAYACEHQVRDILVGGGAKAFNLGEKYTPRLLDKVMEWMVVDQQKSARPARGREQNALYSAGQDLDERGDYAGHVAKSSFYTQASLHPLATTVAAGAVVLGAVLTTAALLHAATPEA
jgi:NAD(P)-dependent dehydrogenase (short-subunit alcohol dehydrogenase family)